MTEAFLIDGVVIILLGATIYVAFRLDRRLQSVRSVQHELAGVIRELNIAAARAEAGIQGLKLAAQSSGQELEEQIRDARAAGDELAIGCSSRRTSGPHGAGGQVCACSAYGRAKCGSSRPTQHSASGSATATACAAPRHAPAVRALDALRFAGRLADGTRPMSSRVRLLPTLIGAAGVLLCLRLGAMAADTAAGACRHRAAAEADARHQGAW
jgi:hypothetical protein